jgi:hypothetical protein
MNIEQKSKDSIKKYNEFIEEPNYGSNVINQRGNETSVLYA